MKIGFIGLGKLGFPCAVAMEQKGGHKVKALDTDPRVHQLRKDKRPFFQEENFAEYLQDTQLELVNSTQELVDWADIIFVAVQTPHDSQYEGISPTPKTKIDFDYEILEKVSKDISESLKFNPEANPLVVVISTVLPGTMKKRVLPNLYSARSNPRFAYNPYFIAMGTTIQDFLNPEFVLIGALDSNDGEILREFYKTIHNAPCQTMQIESAELTKVAYNTFIGFKIVFANTLAEIVEVRGGNVDEITNALAMANVRLMSGKYLSAGMGDGGGCHPRDQIAMSWLADDAKISTDIFGWLASARDKQTERQAQLIAQHATISNLPVRLLGLAYKPNTALTIGSPAKLLSHYLTTLRIEHEIYDPYVYPEKDFDITPGLYFVSTNHAVFRDQLLPAGSVCIDPWGMKRNWGENVSVISPGRENNRA
jgi:UDPglucose 6-dehydrogenase